MINTISKYVSGMIMSDDSVSIVVYGGSKFVEGSMPETTPDTLTGEWILQHPEFKVISDTASYLVTSGYPSVLVRKKVISKDTSVYQFISEDRNSVIAGFTCDNSKDKPNCFSDCFVLGKDGQNKKIVNSSLDTLSTQILTYFELDDLVESTKEHPSLIKRGQELNLNNGRIDTFYVDYEPSYSEVDSLEEMRLSQNRKSSTRDKLELRFCVCTDGDTIATYLDKADSLGSAEGMQFFINFNYSGFADEGNVECDSVLVKAGHLLEVYFELLNKYPKEQFKHVELYRYKREDQSELAKDYSKYVLNQSRLFT